MTHHARFFDPPTQNIQDDSEEETEETVAASQPSEGVESLDSRGIPGWDKVDKLAHALTDLSGLSVTNIQAQEIKTLRRAVTI